MKQIKSYFPTLGQNNSQPQQMTKVTATFQFRFADSKWEDLSLSFKSTQDIGDTIRSVYGRRNNALAFGELHRMVIAHHRASVDLDPLLVSIISHFYEVEVCQDDLVKVNYGFTKMYGDEKQTKLAAKIRKKWTFLPDSRKNEVQLMLDKEPQMVLGSFTIMPGN